MVTGQASSHSGAEEYLCNDDQTWCWLLHCCLVIAIDRCCMIEAILLTAVRGDRARAIIRCQRRQPGAKSPERVPAGEAIMRTAPKVMHSARTELMLYAYARYTLWFSVFLWYHRQRLYHHDRHSRLPSQRLFSGIKACVSFGLARLDYVPPVRCTHRSSTSRRSRVCLM